MHYLSDTLLKKYLKHSKTILQIICIVLCMLKAKLLWNLKPILINLGVVFITWLVSIAIPIYVDIAKYRRYRFRIWYIAHPYCQFLIQSVTDILGNDLYWICIRSFILLLVMGDTKKIKAIWYRCDMDKYSVYRYNNDTILACFQALQGYLYMLWKPLSSLAILISYTFLSKVTLLRSCR